METLGAGGMGTVWKAHDELLRRDVALKALHVGESGARIEREARLAAGLHHPNIVATHDLATVGDESYLVMELIDGRSLADILQERRSLSEAEVRSIGRDVASALAFAHAKGLSHNDIKPANILIDGADMAHVADFGIASGAVATMSVRDAGEIIGSMNYLAPEIVAGEKPGSSADIYSLGVTLFEAASGRLPFGEALAPGVAGRLVRPAPALRTVAPEASEALETCLARALAATPANRYQTASDFLADLASPNTTRPIGVAAATRPRPAAVVAVPGGARRRRGRGTRNRLVVLGAGAALLAGAAFALPGLRTRGGSQGNDVTTPSPTVR